jgi:hypothetical protein
MCGTFFFLTDLLSRSVITAIDDMKEMEFKTEYHVAG